MIGAFQFTQGGRVLRAIFVPGGIRIERLDGDRRTPPGSSQLVSLLMERMLVLLRLGWRRPVMPAEDTQLVVMDIGSLDAPLPTADDTAESLATAYASSEVEHAILASAGTSGDQAKQIWHEAIERAFLDGRAGATAPLVIRTTKSEPSTCVPAPWFDARGSGPSDLALQVRPFTSVPGAPGVRVPPTLGIRILVDHTMPQPTVYTPAAGVVNSGFMLDRPSAKVIYALIGAWLDGSPTVPTSCVDRVRFVDGEVTPTEAAAFRDHLKACEGCRLQMVDDAARGSRISALPVADLGRRTIREATIVGQHLAFRAPAPRPDNKRFFVLNDNYALYYVVATDQDHARQVLVNSGCEFGDGREGTAGALAELEASGEIVWTEIDRAVAGDTQCRTETTERDRGIIPLTQCELGEWFCTEY